MCEFCNKLEEFKTIDIFLNELREKDKRLQHIYTVGIVRSSRKKDGKILKGRSLSFRNKGVGFELNYCPECGNKLRS